MEVASSYLSAPDQEMNVKVHLTPKIFLVDDK